MSQFKAIDPFPNPSVYLPSFKHAQTLEWSSFYSRLPREDPSDQLSCIHLCSSNLLVVCWKNQDNFVFDVKDGVWFLIFTFRTDDRHGFISAVASSFRTSKPEDAKGTWLMLGTSKGQVLLQSVQDIQENNFPPDESFVIHDKRYTGPIISLKYDEMYHRALVSVFKEPSTTSETQGSGTLLVADREVHDGVTILGHLREVLIPDRDTTDMAVPTDIHFLRDTILVTFGNGICHGRSDVSPDGKFLAFTTLGNLKDSASVASLHDGNRVNFPFSGLSKGPNRPRSIVWTSNSEVVFATFEADVCIFSLTDAVYNSGSEGPESGVTCTVMSTVIEYSLPMTITESNMPQKLIVPVPRIKLWSDTTYTHLKTD
ncbi:uncharacterized protein EV420DRAFT_1485880 [Desarmillaria tabescens]|uniref:Uncharacterized protein n=1 Tax=Armillaria tabescens TaxID=1929756 RepID=A0AA39MNC6_ARMTA|nr:uncharacterized protein EV420DRAFT_1485880 [Desarmillaria tabescens]KAK0440672.1 hypothetical protein EV420DRAFT_1485880 [Desarmillaria tabescens]